MHTAAELANSENAVATAAVSKLTSHRLQRLTDGVTLTDTVQAAGGHGGAIFESCSSLGVSK